MQIDVSSSSLIVCIILAIGYLSILLSLLRSPSSSSLSSLSSYGPVPQGASLVNTNKINSLEKTIEALKLELAAYRRNTTTNTISLHSSSSSSSSSFPSLPSIHIQAHGVIILGNAYLHCTFLGFYLTTIIS